MNTVTAPIEEEHHHGPPKGIARWLFSTNHKDIGTMYLIFAMTMLFIGGGMAMLMRAELMYPGVQILEPTFYNSLVTNHALIMIFGMIMPAGTGIANWMIPMMIGAPDMALPRLNNLSFWLLPLAGCLLLSGYFMPGGAAAGGWTLYPPLSIQQPMGMDFLILAIHILGISSILASINIIVTIVNMRAPGMSWGKLPLFVWAWLVTAWLLITTLPVLAGGITMLLFDRHFGTSFFNAAGGGDPVLFQHLFWFFGHPEVYVLVLPAFGILGSILPTFARKPLFGYKSCVGAILTLSWLAMIVWAHHQYTIGMSRGAIEYFMIVTIIISIPIGLLVFNYILTLWKGSMSFETPMLFAISVLILFSFGGLTGVMLAVIPADLEYHDTMFVVAHFHYVLIPGAFLGLVAGVFYWLPKWTGNMYDERLGKLFFWMAMVGFNMTFFVQHFVGLAGMPRRIIDYSVQFAEFNMVSSIGAFIFGASHLVFLYVVIKCVRGKPKEKLSNKVWDGANAPGNEGLEWHTESPPAFHTFTTAPKITW